MQSTLFRSRFSASAMGATCLLLATLGTMRLAGAQESAPSPANAAPAATAVRATARLRLFGQNGAMIDFYENSACVGGDGPKTRVSGGMGDAFSSFIGSVKNTSIGMTATPTLAHLEKRNGFFSKAYFREYEVAAGQPVSLDMHMKSAPSGPSCGQFGGTFKPEAGKEYEVTLDLEGRLCLPVVREIQKDPQGEVSLKDVTLLQTYKCP